MQNNIDWLMDSDPAIRWQVLQGLQKAPTDAIGKERSRIASEGWGKRLLDLQDNNGHWGGEAYIPDEWISTTYTLSLLRDLGLDPQNNQAKHAINLVASHCTWGPEFGDSPFFEGEVEPCINGTALAIGSYFGHASKQLADRLLAEQLEDGGWNCRAPQSTRSSFHTTICVLEGLLEYQNATGKTSEVSKAIYRGNEYLLERRLFRSLTTGEIINPGWMKFSFPCYWRYDVLRGLDYLRKAEVKNDPRLAEAVSLVKSKQDNCGRWALEDVLAGSVHFEMESGIGTASRWNTLRALRVLLWFK